MMDRMNTYQTIVEQTFVPPVNPGATMTIPPDSTSPKISALERTFNSKLKEWKHTIMYIRRYKNNYWHRWIPSTIEDYE